MCPSDCHRWAKGGVFPPPSSPLQPDLKIRGGVRTSQQLCRGLIMPAGLNKATGTLCQDIAWLEHLGSSTVGEGVCVSFFLSVPCDEHNTQSCWHPASIMWSPGDAKGAGEKRKTARISDGEKVERLACKLCQQPCLEAGSRMGEMGFKDTPPTRILRVFEESDGRAGKKKKKGGSLMGIEGRSSAAHI